MPRKRKVMMPRGAIQQKAEWSGSRGSYLTAIPNLAKDTMEEMEVFSIREPFTYARILYDHDRSEYIYEVWEPHLDAREKEFLDMIKDSLNRTLEYEWDKMAEKDKKEYISEAVDSFIKSRGLRLEPASKDKIVYYIIRDFVGYGPVDVLMADLRIEDVSCDGTSIPLFVFHQKYESIKTNVIFDDDDALNSFVVLLGQRCAKQISVANPILDGTSFEGHRVQATYAREVTTRGSSFTIRRYKDKPFTPVELVKFGTASADMVAYLWVAVESGKSMMVCGGTASGKTATLNSAALFIRPGAKIVSIEDTREINLPHENWIPGVTRSGVGERGADGKAGGEIDMYDLVRAALRQRPNYIVVGEVRGKETYTMFQAMATGHPTMSTMHADSVKSMVNRLENPPINTPRILLTALNFVIIQSHARIGDSIVRRMKQIVELVGFEPETNELITNTVYEWDAATDTFVYKGHSFLFDEIMEMKNMTHEEMEAEFARRIDIVNYMVQKGMTDFREIAKIVVQYYQYPDETAKRVREEMGLPEAGIPKAVEAGGETVGQQRIREARDARDAHEDEAVQTRRTDGKGAPHGEAAEGREARQREPDAEAASRVAHVREVRAGPEERGPGPRGEPPAGAHQAPAGRISRGRLDEHDVRRGGRGDRRLRRRLLPVLPPDSDFHPAHHARPGRGHSDLLLVHVFLRSPGRVPWETGLHGQEARPQDRQEDLGRDVVHLGNGLGRRPRRRDLQGTVQADDLRRGRPRGGMDHPGHRTARPRHLDRDPEGLSALAVGQVPGLLARRRDDVDERRSAETLLPREGRAVRKGRPPRDAEEDGDARDACRVLRDRRRGVPLVPRRHHGDHGPDQQGLIWHDPRASVRRRGPHDSPESVRFHLRHLEHGAGGLR